MREREGKRKFRERETDKEEGEIEKKNGTNTLKRKK